MLKATIIGTALLAVLLFPLPVSGLAPTPTPASKSTNKILFQSTSKTGWDLFTVNADGTGLTQLTNVSGGIPSFGWSRDGQYIAFTTFGAGFSTALILNVMNADGSDLHQVSPNITRGFGWSPDNKQIAYVSNQSGLGEIYLVDHDGNNTKQLTHGDPHVYMNDVYDLSWSPDGKQIAFIRPYQLYIINIDGSNETALTASNNSATAVSWSPDGKLIAFAMTANNQSAIYTIQPGASNFEKLIDIPDDYTSIDWSPDGQHLDYTQKNNGEVSLFIVDADGKNNHQLATSIGGYSWSPDSQHLVYSTFDANLKSTMYIIGTNGQNQKQLPGNNTFDNSPLWSPAQ